MKYSKNLILILLLAFIVSCKNKTNDETTQKQTTRDQKPPEQVTQNKERSTSQMKIMSTAFNDGGMIPQKYTCEGDNISPEVSWSGNPDGIKSYALIVSDPDAPNGDWVHWVIYNMAPTVNELKEKILRDKILPDGSKHGYNSFKKPGWDGPCPPGGTHRYFFKLYALDKVIDKSDLTKPALLKEMQGHILDTAELMGKYTKMK